MWRHGDLAGPSRPQGLHCDVTAETLREMRQEGVDVLWMNGGPVKPRHVCAIVVLQRARPR